MNNGYRLTVGTLDTRSSILFVLVHLVAVGRGASLLPVVGLLESDLVHVNVFAELADALSGGQGLLQGRDDSRVDRLGELDVDSNVKVSKFVVSERRHTLVGDDLERVCSLVSAPRATIPRDSLGLMISPGTIVT